MVRLLHCFTLSLKLTGRGAVQGLKIETATLQRIASPVCPEIDRVVSKRKFVTVDLATCLNTRNLAVSHVLHLSHHLADDSQKDDHFDRVVSNAHTIAGSACRRFTHYRRMY